MKIELTKTPDIGSNIGSFDPGDVVCRFGDNVVAYDYYLICVTDHEGNRRVTRLIDGKIFLMSDFDTKYIKVGNLTISN